MPARALSLCALAAALVALVCPARGAADGGAIYLPGRWQLTQYWIAEERAAPEDHRPANLFAPSGRVVAFSCPAFVEAITMEGTGRTWDGRLLNWASRINGRACFREVDKRFIPIGHTVEIPELIGLPLPDGSPHDGCFVAVDGGGAINGHHIDLFVPSAETWRELGRAGYLPSRVRGLVVDSPRCADARRYAVIPVPGDVPLPR